MTPPLATLIEAAPEQSNPAAQALPPEDELLLTARRKITLQCGKASITLHANGKIVLRGEYILSQAAGTQRITGGQIEIN